MAGRVPGRQPDVMYINAYIALNRSCLELLLTERPQSSISVTHGFICNGAGYILMIHTLSAMTHYLITMRLCFINEKFTGDDLPLPGALA